MGTVAWRRVQGYSVRDELLDLVEDYEPSLGAADHGVKIGVHRRHRNPRVPHLNLYTDNRQMRHWFQRQFTKAQPSCSLLQKA